MVGGRGSNVGGGGSIFGGGSRRGKCTLLTGGGGEGKEKGTKAEVDGQQS
jgi:hypothetical protein